jgi:dienelactone hydrolase
MQGRLRTVVGLLLAGCLFCISPASGAERPVDAFPHNVAVTQTYDGKPFECSIESHVVKNGYSVLRLHYPSPVVTRFPQNNRVPAEYYLPSGMRPADPPRPAVICLHILDGSFALTQWMCSILASQGIPALMFKLPYYGERALPEGPEVLARDPELFVGAVEQTGHDIKRTVDLLASRPEVNPKLIGITGISLGAITALASAGDDPRLHRVVAILAGGDLEHIIGYARETRELAEAIATMPDDARAKVRAALWAADPLRQAPKLRDRAQAGRVLMINATDDHTIPREATEKLARALGISDRVVWLEGLGHYTTAAEMPNVMQRTADFFAQDLAPGLRKKPPAITNRTPLEVIATLVRQLGQFLSDPSDGRCHIADLLVNVIAPGQKPVDAEVRFIRGPRWTFRLECRVPQIKEIGHVAIGQGDYPWMLSGGKALFKGVLTDLPGENGQQSPRGIGDPWTYVDPNYAMTLRMVSGAAMGVALAPDILEQWISLRDSTNYQGRKQIEVTFKEKVKGHLLLTLRDDGQTPQELVFDVEGIRGQVAFRGWRTDAVAADAMFEAPDRVSEVPVLQDDLYRTFGAMFNFIVENIE